jgi:hypothetical protein
MILFLFADHKYYVPTFSVLFSEISGRSNDDLQLLDVNTVPIDKIKQSINNSSVIVFDISIFNMVGIGDLPPYFFTSQRKVAGYYFDIWYYVEKKDKPVFLLASLLDLHYPNFRLERHFYLGILRRCSGIIWPYSDPPAELYTVPEKYHSVFKSYSLQEVNTRQIWKEIVSIVPVSIDFPHFISKSEIINKDAAKYWDLVVPGAAYKTRVIAKESILKEGLKLAPYKFSYRWFANVPYYMYKKIANKEKSTGFHQKRSFAVQNFLLRHSKAAFTCGSELRYFVRKFLEVPANNSILIAYPSDSMSNYGFIDGINYISCLPEEAGSKARAIIKNKGLQGKIKMNAKELLIRLHTSEVRVDQLLNVIQAFQKGQLKGASFVAGRFEIF